MNFQTIPPVPLAKELLNATFRKSRERANVKKFSGELWQRLQKRELLKVDMAAGNLKERLERLVERFPVASQLPSFYATLLKVTLDFPLFRKSLGALRWASLQITVLQKHYVRKMSRERNLKGFQGLTKEFYGRVSSVIKQVDPQLKELEAARKILRTYPDIKEGLFTVCLYGFPNVGKTTLLNLLAKTKAKTAAYAFTTLTINSGFMTLDGKTIQVLDVPGTLARPDKMNPIEQQAELVVQELADVIVFVLDLSEQCGYSLARQEQLLAKAEKRKSVLLYVSKKDLLHKEQLALYPHAYSEPEELKQEILRRAEQKERDEKKSEEAITEKDAP
ncbi:MAG: GTPase [Nanoarchaeota archaeon]|nr:GTPase [Nanoarchaeota archaeon]